MSISISHLSKQYGSQTVLHDVSLHLAPGEVAGFLGPNGAGKTTTMRILAGATPYDTGSVQVCGLEVKDHRLEANALIGYLPEQNPLYPRHVREGVPAVRGRHLPPGQKAAAARGRTDRPRGAHARTGKRKSASYPKATASAWDWRKPSCPTPAC